MSDDLIGYCVTELYNNGFTIYNKDSRLVLLDSESNYDDLPFDAVNNYIDTNIDLILDQDDVIILVNLGTVDSSIRIFRKNKLVLNRSITDNNINFFINSISYILQLLTSSKFNIITKYKINRMLNHDK